MGRKLYVGNLPYETGEAELQELFAGCGNVDTVRVMRDMATGRARGFAFVEMATDDEARAAITQLNAHQLGGRGSMSTTNILCRSVRIRKHGSPCLARWIGGGETDGKCVSSQMVAA